MRRPRGWTAGLFTTLLLWVAAFTLLCTGRAAAATPQLRVRARPLAAQHGPPSAILLERDHCTLIMVGRQASTDGSVMTAHTDDSGPATSDLRLVLVPAADHAEGAMRPVYNIDGSYPRLVDGDRSPAYAPKGQQNRSVPLGFVPQVRHTWAYFETDYGLMNEKQLAMAESTCGSRTLGPLPLGSGGSALFSIEELSRVALERCASARCAVQTMGALATQYGYFSQDRDKEDSAEALGVADGAEAWMFHIMPAADDAPELGPVWAAARVPDGAVTVCANMFTIRQMNLADADNYMASDNVHAVAQKLGWWDGVSPFDFTAAYASQAGAEKSGGSNYYSGRRIWRIFDRVAPSARLDPEAGHINNETTYPFAIKPDFKVSPQDVFRLLRDHYEGTKYDLTVGPSAGPFGDPVRYSGGPAEARVQKMGAWERGISIHRTSWSFVTQSFAARPAGGLVWYGQDSPHATVYVPFFAVQRVLPPAWLDCKQSVFSRSCSWWAFNFLKNWASLRYERIIVDVRVAQERLERAGAGLAAALGAQVDMLQALTAAQGLEGVPLQRPVGALAEDLAAAADAALAAVSPSAADELAVEVAQALAAGAVEAAEHIGRAAGSLEARVADATAALLAASANRHADWVVSTWWSLGEALVAKYSNGYITTAEGNRESPGYPLWWICASSFFNFPDGNEGSVPCPFDSGAVSVGDGSASLGRIQQLLKGRPRAMGPA